MKQVPTREILQTALQWVEKHPMPIALASTTGQTARELMELAGTQAIRLIVITHDPKRTYKKIRFDKSVREKLIKSGYTFLEDRAPWLPRISISRLFERTFNISSLSKKNAHWLNPTALAVKFAS